MTFPNVTKQNITELLYKASLINNSDVQESAAITALITGICQWHYSNTGDVQNDINNGTLTEDTYIVWNPTATVDTAKRIVDNY